MTTETITMDAAELDAAMRPHFHVCDVPVSRDATAEAVAAARCEVLDKMTEDAGLSTPEERAAWAASAKPSGARRQWARLRLREAWCLWYGRAW